MIKIILCDSKNKTLQLFHLLITTRCLINISVINYDILDVTIIVALLSMTTIVCRNKMLLLK